MRVLIVKTSSLGDVVHTLPALTEAKNARPEIEFSWLIEEAYVDIPALHSAVNDLIPIAFRRWRKSPFSPSVWREWQSFKKHLNEQQYDLILDAQGLMKSAWMASLANGPVSGFDHNSARESWASLLYQKKVPVDKGQHAIERLRQLFSHALEYPLSDARLTYGLDASVLDKPDSGAYVLFLHGTTWPSKQWPSHYWVELAKKFNDEGLLVYLPWGNNEERARAEKIADSADNVRLLPKMNLAAIAGWIAHADTVVGVDSGLSHLATALSVPTLTLFGASDKNLTGVLGEKQKNISVEFECSPCLKKKCSYNGREAELPACLHALTPAKVWVDLVQMRTQQGS